jgi:hypothetical protein
MYFATKISLNLSLNFSAALKFTKLESEQLTMELNFFKLEILKTAEDIGC